MNEDGWALGLLLVAVCLVFAGTETLCRVLFDLREVRLSQISDVPDAEERRRRTAEMQPTHQRVSTERGTRQMTCLATIRGSLERIALSLQPSEKAWLLPLGVAVILVGFGVATATTKHYFSAVMGMGGALALMISNALLRLQIYHDILRRVDKEIWDLRSQRDC